MKDLILSIFGELNDWMDRFNSEVEEGSQKIRPVEVRIMGQFTLLTNEAVAQILSLQRTNDLDAVIEKNDWEIKRVLNKEILPKHGLHLDLHSDDIWIAPGSTYELLHEFKNVRVKLLDPESALVSKAVKDPKKNKNLIIDAIASGRFPGLVERIRKNGGNLDFFVEDEIENE